MQDAPQGFVLEQELAAAQQKIASLEQEKARLESDKEGLRQRLLELQRLLFGAKSERFVPLAIPGQLQLELEGLEEIATAHKKMVAAYERSQGTEASKHQGRMPIPEHLERVEEKIEPEEDTTDMKHIGDTVTEVLEYQPGRLWVRRIVRPKYARKTVAEGQSEVVVAPMPDQAFPKMKAGVSLLVYLVISKFAEHLPLYRLCQILARQGVKIPESTMGEWVKVAIERLDVLYAAYKRLLLQSSYLQMDETRLQVLEESTKGKAHLGYIWAIYDPIQKLPFYTYLPGRSHHGPRKLLEPFAGHLQSDGYSVYELLNKIMPAITLVNCWAHARREFIKAQDNDQARATEALKKIQALYKIEQEARQLQLSPEERLVLRQQKSKPLWEELFAYLKAELEQVLPKSPIGSAIAYTLKRKENLGRFLDDGRIEIDNNLVENAIRPIAIGRKNYLFAGNHESAQRIAVIYTLINACKHHNIDPYLWLQDVLGKLHRQPINRIEELLPQNWMPAQHQEQQR
ncbi:MAG: IS66 family transposase [Lewinellaceae bacterium]|nr:IS66 family transposase [Lewinellaceae bacterium]